MSMTRICQSQIIDQARASRGTDIEHIHIRGRNNTINRLPHRAAFNHFSNRVDLDQAALVRAA